MPIKTKTRNVKIIQAKQLIKKPPYFRQQYYVLKQNRLAAKAYFLLVDLLDIIQEFEDEMVNKLNDFLCGL